MRKAPLIDEMQIFFDRATNDELKPIKEMKRSQTLRLERAEDE